MLRELWAELMALRTLPRVPGRELLDI